MPEAQIINLIRDAYALGWTEDQLVIDYAVQAVGEEHRARVESVFAARFKVAEGI